MKHIAACLLSLCCATGALAHPHIFVDTGLELRFGPDGRLQQIEITWVYDELSSLLVTESMELDTDFDGKLTPEEQERLTGFDMNWIEGFNGDLEIYQNDRLLTLSGPSQATASYDGARIKTTHVRDIRSEVSPSDPLSVLPYDQTFYSAYDVTLPVVLKGREGCRHSLEIPDPSEMNADILDQLGQLDSGSTPEEAGLPNIGRKMATTVTVTCPVS
ncbi:MAG: DUF1007 family protein [Sulfitobacter sp.]|nr:DUF1007 family protein [Sulfitobacter sp.]